MLDVDLRVTLVARLLLRGDERLLRFFGELVRIYHFVACSISGLRPGDTLKADGLAPRE